MLEIDLNATCLGHRLRQADHLLKNVREFDRFGRKIEPADLDARNVEHLVDEVEKMTSPLDDHFSLLALAGSDEFAQQELAESEDGIERGAQFMAHAGQEFALGATGRVHFLHGLVQGRLDALRLGDVAGDGVDRGRSGRDGGTGPGQPAPAAVLAAIAVLEGEHILPLGQLRQRLPGGQEIVGMHKGEKRLGGQLIGSVSQGLAKGGIDAEEITLRVGNAQQIEGQAEEEIAFHFRILALGDLDSRANGLDRLARGVKGHFAAHLRPDRSAVHMKHAAFGIDFARSLAHHFFGLAFDELPVVGMEPGFPALDAGGDLVVAHTQDLGQDGRELEMARAIVDFPDGNPPLACRHLV